MRNSRRRVSLLRVTFRTTGEPLPFVFKTAGKWVANVPISNSRRPNIYFNITSPTPGTFIIALHYKGREKAILEMDLNIDDLLEKVGCHDIPLYHFN